MEDEFVKRNTDCVYFLASPFTCKKGAECEYRHSEIARLNPRDCWYWLSANCLNPTCAFRHPPLDLHNEASVEAAPPLLNQSSVSSKKTKVPCYYYYNGFCIKGDRCPYLHEPGDTFGLKQKMADTCADAPVLPLDEKTSGRADSGSILAGKHSNLSEMATKTVKEFQGEQVQLAQQPATAIFMEPNTSEKIDIPQCQETVAGKTMSLQPAEASIKSESLLSLDSDRSSVELIDGNIMRDEWLESSPGFDVLVDGKTEDIVCEDNPEYLHALDRDDEDCERLYVPHVFSHEGEYGERSFFDNGLYESSEHFDDELGAHYREYSARRTQDRKARRVVASKRKFFCEESPFSDCHDVDLRDYLRKRGMIDGYLETHDLRHNLVHQVRDDWQDSFQRHASIRRTHGRIASKVERNGVRFPRRKYSAADTVQRSRPGKSQHSGFRRYNGTKSQQSLTERRSYSKREGYAQDSTTFYGPKGLAVTKEDRKVGYFNKIESVDFEGPKPLSEILRDKKKTAFSGDDFLSSSN